MGKRLETKSAVTNFNNWSEFKIQLNGPMLEEERGGCSGEQNGGTTVWQRSPEIIVHREYVVEADQRNDGNRVST
jgi:hypothetical protein